MFDVDRKVEVDESSLVVTEDGVPVATSAVEQEAHERVFDLAKQVAERATEIVPADYEVADGGTTAIEIEDDGEHRTIEFRSGDETPDVIWDLLDAIEEIQRAADSTDEEGPPEDHSLQDGARFS